MTQASGVDLTNCDREPIHIPGAIQPHGVLLAFDESTLIVIQASANAAESLSINTTGETSGFAGSPVAALLGHDAVAAIRDSLLSQTHQNRPHYTSRLRIRTRPELWSAATHRIDDVLLLELQPEAVEPIARLDTQEAIRKAVADLDVCDSLADFCQAATLQFRDLTGFDRVMVYRFLDDGSGVVIAESCNEDLSPYLGLHYPASDIPLQARELYRLNPFRLTADVHASAVPLVPALNPRTNQPLDLSFCSLRATSPVHLEYLHNMGVAASLSFSIVHNDKLWGLVACHHGARRVLPQQTRVAGEILARFVGLQVGIKEEAEQKQYAVRLQNMRGQLRTQLLASGDYVTALVRGEPNLLTGIEADGTALCTGSQTILLGHTPPPEKVEALIQWLKKQPWQASWATDSLSILYPPAAGFMKTASGILVLRIAESSPETVIWFRPEVLQTVNWAGNPTKPVGQVTADGEVQLHPCRSFALWKEQLSGQSMRWRPLELEHALALHEDMLQALLKHRMLEVSRLNAELTRSNQELEQFASVASHDLQEPLRTVSAYTELLFRRRNTVSEPEATEMIEFILSATKRMSKLIKSLLEFARCGKREGASERISVEQALQLALSNLRTPIAERSAQISSAPLPVVRAHEDQLARVFQNLIGNALKYCPADRQPVLQITAERETQDWVISLKDNGAGFDPGQTEAIFQPFYRLRENEADGTGLGLAICRKVIESLGGRIWAETIPGDGSTFRFTLPAG